MSYIGRSPTVGNFQICDAISTVNNQAAYTMQVGSVNVIPETANHMIVSLNGVIQAPISSFTVSGSTITFAANLVTGDVINFIQILGDVLDLGVPSDGTVTSGKLGADSVNATKIADGSIENEHLNVLAVTGQTAETSIADGDTILIHDASASALRKMTKANFVAGVGENNRPYILAAMHPSGTATLSNETTTKVPFNQQLISVDGTYSESDARWTPGVAGRYYIQAQIFIDYGNAQGNRMDLKIYVNGSRVVESRLRAGGDFSGTSTALVTGIVTLSASQYVEIFAFGSMGGNKNYDKTQIFAWFNGFKIANT